MTEGNVIYTNGRDVTVTDTTFVVRNIRYRLNGITQYSFSVLKAERIPCILLLVLSLLLMISGLLDTFPNPQNEFVTIEEGVHYGANKIAIWGGAFLAAVSVLLMFVLRKRYAVRISTAEGDKDAVISTQKEYISQIVDALNIAFNKVYASGKKARLKLMGGLKA